jgi:hypothetical protein
MIATIDGMSNQRAAIFIAIAVGAVVIAIVMSPMRSSLTCGWKPDALVCRRVDQYISDSEVSRKVVLARGVKVEAYKRMVFVGGNRGFSEVCAIRREGAGDHLFDVSCQLQGVIARSINELVTDPSVAPLTYEWGKRGTKVVIASLFAFAFALLGALMVGAKGYSIVGGVLVITNRWLGLFTTEKRIALADIVEVETNAGDESVKRPNTWVKKKNGTTRVVAAGGAQTRAAQLAIVATVEEARRAG